MNLIIPGWESVLQMLIPMCTVICIAGAILLLLNAEGSRSKRLLAYVMLAWGIAYVIRIFGILLGFMGTMESSVLDPFVFESRVIFMLSLPFSILLKSSAPAGSTRNAVCWSCPLIW